MTDEQRLLFLAHKHFEQGTATRGGALVTNEQTRPLEFRCTSPIRPTEYQRALYGDTLEDTIFEDLIAKPLIEKAGDSVSLVVVEDERFLAVRPELDVPVARVVPAPEAGAEDGPSIEVHPDFEGEREAVKAMLHAVQEQGVDLLEPFERIRRVLDQAHDRKVGDEQRDA